MSNVLRHILLLPLPPLLPLPRALPHISRRFHHSLLPLPTRPSLPSNGLRRAHCDCSATSHVRDGDDVAEESEAERGGVSRQGGKEHEYEAEGGYEGDG